MAHINIIQNQLVNMKLMMNERTNSTDKSLLVWNLMHKIDSNEVPIDLPAEVTVILLKFTVHLNWFPPYVFLIKNYFSSLFSQ
jgi:hypothetical protein